MTPVFTTVLTIAIVILFLLTFILVKYIPRKKKANKLLADFYGVAAQFNFFISKQEVLGNRIIGLDDINNKLLYFSGTSDKHEGYLVDLYEIKSSTVKREYGFINSYNKYPANPEPTLEKIVLQLYYKSGAKPLELAFYDQATDFVYEMQHRVANAIEWQALVSNRLKRTANVIKLRKKSMRAAISDILLVFSI